jgi:predicted transglutaminase-like cysteine proteinase
MRRLIGRSIVLLLAMLAMSPAPSMAMRLPLVGGGEQEDGSRVPLPQWARAMERLAADRASYEHCAQAGARCAETRLAAWSGLLLELRGQPRDRQIRAVNSFVNRQPYRTDLEVWGRRDYWATPREFFSRSGDCEDYAIAKYVSLRRLGMPAADLRLLVVRDTWRGVDHAVLAAREGDAWYILDNLNRAVLPQGETITYQPYYALNETAHWTYATIPEATIRTGAR